MLQAAPRLGPAYNNLGALYFRQGRYSQAIPILRSGLRVDPGMSSASALLGISLFLTGDFAAARGPLEAAVHANATDDHAALYLAQDLMKLGDWNAAASRLSELARQK